MVIVYCKIAFRGTKSNSGFMCVHVENTGTIRFQILFGHTLPSEKRQGWSVRRFFFFAFGVSIPQQGFYSIGDITNDI